MKTFRLSLILLLGLLFIFTGRLFSQTCIDESEANTAWTNIPYFDGAESYINVNELNATETNNASYWFTGSFSIDMWLRCTWPDDYTSDNTYFFFAAGPWDDDYNSLLLYFEETSEGNWRIRISDGNDSGGNTDIMYYIDYDGDYMNQWKHVALTYDDYTMRLYIDGVKKKEGSFTFNKIPYQHCVLGGHDSNHSEDFRGYISGFRVWTDIKLTDSQVSYIWDKTFNDEETFGNYSYLYDILNINIFKSK